MIDVVITAIFSVLSGNCRFLVPGPPMKRAFKGGKNDDTRCEMKKITERKHGRNTLFGMAEKRIDRQTGT